MVLNAEKSSNSNQFWHLLRCRQLQGYRIQRLFVGVFVGGSALAGLGGVLHVSFLRVAAPASFTMLESINTVLIVIIGGAGFLVGPVLGAVVFVALPEGLRLANEWRLVIFGALLVLITLFAPSGLAGLLSRGWARLGAAPKEPGP